MKEFIRRQVGIALIPVLKKILAQPKMREWALLHLSNELSMRQASFPRDLPGETTTINGFEDCTFLFSNNKLNHGLSRLRFDEAAFLYRLTRSLPDPRVVELGRYKGGTTLIFAAAGATVLSLDNGALPDIPRFTQELETALKQVHLADRVEAVMADAQTYPVELNAADLVFLDCAREFEDAHAVFAHWWPAVKPGAKLVLCDGVDSPWEGVVAFAGQVPALYPDARRTTDSCGSFAVFEKASA